MSTCLSDEEVLAFAIGRLPAARQAEAHVHLDQCDTCQHLLSEAAHALATAATLPLQDSERVILTTMFRPGMLVAQRYMIRRFIARGGMGEVYEAFDQDMQQRVALKTVTSTASDSSTAVRKLKEEVALARRVSHTNVCRIYDLGRHVVAETGAKVSFLTMELVEGETLGQRIRLGGALPVAEARKLARELLEGLKAAHDSGVLHRDFKSDNVMLCNEGDDGTKPLILDFGLARQLDRDNAHSRSSHGAMLGTYGYIAPELVDRPHSKASDVYAFGIVWFEMLTGELPFASSSSSKILTLESAEPNAPAPSAINPAVPRNLDAIVLGCLRRSPKDRYRTAGEALAALDEMEAQEIAAARLKRLIPRMVAGVIAVLAVYFAVTRLPVEPIAAVNAAVPAPVPTAPTAAPETIDAGAQVRLSAPPAASAGSGSSKTDPLSPPSNRATGSSRAKDHDVDQAPDLAASSATPATLPPTVSELDGGIFEKFPIDGGVAPVVAPPHP